MQSSIQRAPIARLKPVVQFLWASSHQTMPEGLIRSQRERMIPTACMHLVFRFSRQPIRIFRSMEDVHGDAFYRGVVGGIRSAYYIKDIAGSACTVGASLQPGACEALFGIAADEISDHHVSLEDLWGSPARSLWQRLEEISGLEERLHVLESFLAKQLSRDSGMHPAIAYALSSLSTGAGIGSIVEETGYSHRHFVKLFRQSVGLAPHLYSRLLRFQRTLKHGFDETGGRWIDVALEAGYADQAHFNREFRELAGVSPTEYILNRREGSHHVLIPGQFCSIRGNLKKA
jgi:AraC-like DNA-binding protein